ncbi:MAG: FAD-dependent oxidoreductase [Bacteroidota bacterium]
MRDPVHILGGGLAGLATAYYAQRHGLAPTVFEAAPTLGGNARTLRFEDALVDTGAHRLHDKHAGATAAWHALLGDALRRVEAPSEIRYQGRGIAFPLRPLDAARQLGPRTLARVAVEVLPRLLRRSGPPATFRDLALDRYGPTLAESFLLSYSEKLWGLAANRLDPQVAGGRLRGLTVGTFLREFAGPRTATAHLDGVFLYPQHGFGMLADALAEAVGPDHLRTNARVTRVGYTSTDEGRTVQAVVVNHGAPVPVTQVVSTLPLSLLLGLLDPAPPAAVREAAARLRYRHVRLAILRLGRPSYSSHASLYFPEPSLPFTRLYEPKNRSPEMAPSDRTALVVEVPCSARDAWWTHDDESFTEALLAHLRRALGARLDPVLSMHSLRLPHAYPVLEVGHRVYVERVQAYLRRFTNLTLAGRASTFRYLHTHDLFAEAESWASRHAALRSVARSRTGTRLRAEG